MAGPVSIVARYSLEACIGARISLVRLDNQRRSASRLEHAAGSACALSVRDHIPRLGLSAPHNGRFTCGNSVCVCVPKEADWWLGTRATQKVQSLRNHLARLSSLPFAPLYTRLRFKLSSAPLNSKGVATFIFATHGQIRTYTLLTDPHQYSKSDH